MNTLASQPTLSRISARAIPAIAAILVGLALFFTTGFAWPSTLHDATHDTRHALGLPCH
jgi:cobalt transporter subunit CbtB